MREGVTAALLAAVLVWPAAIYGHECAADPCQRAVWVAQAYEACSAKVEQMVKDNPYHAPGQGHVEREGEPLEPGHELYEKMVVSAITDCDGADKKLRTLWLACFGGAASSP